MFLARSIGARAGSRPLARPIARIQGFAHERNARIIGLTSIAGGSGVSLLSGTLARSFSNLGRRTLLVDASRLIIEPAALAEERTTTFDLLGSARATGAGLSSIDLAQFSHLVQAGKGAFREMFSSVAASGTTIVVDLPPTADAAGDVGAAFLAAGTACDLTLLVCLAGAIGKDELRNAVEVCKLNDIPLGGVIANDWKLPVAGLLGDA